MGEKTEKATPKKLRDAREKGQVAKSQDFPSAMTFIVSISVTLALSGYLWNLFSGFFLTIYQQIPDLNFEVMANPIMEMAILTIFKASIPVLVFVVFTGVVINFLLVGPVFSFHPFKPDIKKFNPVTNLKNKFKMKTLFELLKSLFKITGAAVLIYLTIWDKVPEIIGTVRIPLESTVILFKNFLMEVIIKVGLFFLIVAVADLLYQKHNFAKEMMMEKHEIKQEHKNTEGDPIIKGKRKEVAREIAYSAGPEARVSLAKAVVTNPVHLAIAIGYDAEKDPAPFLLAKGSGHTANLIVKEAEKHDIPVLRNIPLAHQLFDEGEEYAYVPIETYETIAEILKWVASLQGEDIEKAYEIETEETEIDV